MNIGDKLTPNELVSLLASWPEGTVGYQADVAAIKTLDRIGAELGYGWLHQLAQFLYETQCHGSTKNAANLKRSRFESLGWTLPKDFESVAAK